MQTVGLPARHAPPSPSDRPLLQEGGPVSYQPRPSPSSTPNDGTPARRETSPLAQLRPSFSDDPSGLAGEVMNHLLNRGGRRASTESLDLGERRPLPFELGMAPRVEMAQREVSPIALSREGDGPLRGWETGVGAGSGDGSGRRARMPFRQAVREGLILGQG